jgi:signal peptidase I
VTPAPSPAQGEHDGLLALIRPVLEIVAVAIFFLTFVVQPFRIPSASMQPTLQVGDCLLMDKQSFAAEGPLHRLLPPSTIHRGDLVVFHFPVPNPNEPELQLVKRIVGLPGDRIRLRQGRVLLNGQPLAEPYAFYSPTQPDTFRDDFPQLRELDPNVDPRWWIALRRTIAYNEITVPPGQFFVLGDNRNNSEDSRYWGFVPQHDIVGRPLLVYFSAAPQGTWFQRIKLGIESFRIVR